MNTGLAKAVMTSILSFLFGGMGVMWAASSLDSAQLYGVDRKPWALLAILIILPSATLSGMAITRIAFRLLDRMKP